MDELFGTLNPGIEALAHALLDVSAGVECSRYLREDVVVLDVWIPQELR